MRLFIFILPLLFANSGNSQTFSAEAGCTLGWIVRVDGITAGGEDIDTLFCQVGDTVEVGLWHDAGGNCPNTISYEWYYYKRVCNKLNLFSPDTVVYGFSPYTDYTKWFRSSDYAGDLTINYVTISDCIDLTIVRLEPTGVQLLNPEKWNVFYDPFSQKIKTITEESSAYQLNIYSLDGRVLDHVKATGNQMVDVSELPSGIYIASIETERGSLRKKLMIQPY